MKIRKAKIEDLEEIQKLICNVYSKFNFKEGTKNGVQEYLDYHNPKKNLKELIEKWKKHEIRFVALEGNQIVGVIRGRRDKIGNLFVEGKTHRKGIASKLVEKFEMEALNLDSKEIKLKFSIYAIDFYQKMGYKKTTGIRNLHGLQIQPMEKKLK